MSSMRHASLYYEFLEMAESVDGLVNTHAHLLRDRDCVGHTLHQRIQMTYSSWIHRPFDDTREGRAAYFEAMGTNTYCTWLAKAYGRLYGQDGAPLSAGNWDAIAEQVEAAYRQDPLHHLSILREDCRYGSILLDRFDEPGNDNGHPDLFRPILRCDMFLHGENETSTDDNGSQPYRWLGIRKADLSFREYLDAIRDALVRACEQGVVGLKVAIAYERTLAFLPVDDAAQVLELEAETDLTATAEDEEDFA